MDGWMDRSKTWFKGQLVLVQKNGLFEIIFLLGMQIQY
jgi:hypothetical protein